uniref:Uncharacterized protein n=1 Tax=Magallana gigas TaxID=29159 RepID=A0A8W8I5H6_MAGGI
MRQLLPWTIGGLRVAPNPPRCPAVAQCFHIHLPSSATVFVVYDSLSEKTRMRRGILREMEKARADKKAESVAEQKKSWNEWKEAKKAENRRKREEMNTKTETIGS